MTTQIKIYTGVYIKQGTEAVCCILTEVNQQTEFLFLEMENVRGLCTLLTTEVRKWIAMKSVLGDIEIELLINNRNKNAQKALSKVRGALEKIPAKTVGSPRENLIKFHIRNKNYTKQLAYDQLVSLTEACLDYGLNSAPGTIKLKVVSAGDVGYMKSAWGAAQGHWNDLQAEREAKASQPDNVLTFPSPLKINLIV
jgi:hypothetical protein